MNYFQVFADFIDVIEPLNNEERGVLFTAMLLYAGRDIVPELTGNERFLWPVAKMNIDRQKTSYENKVAGAEKARRLKRVDTKSDQDNGGRSPLIPTQDKDKDKEKDKEKIKEISTSTDDRFEQFWQAYPRKVGKGNARTVWQKIKMTDELFATILNAVEQQKQWEQWQKDNGQFIPLPATWLNQQRWDDLGIVVPKKKSKYDSLYAKVRIN